MHEASCPGPGGEMAVRDGPVSLTSMGPPGSFTECPRSAGRKLTNSVRTPQVAAVSAVIVAAGSLGHFRSGSTSIRASN